YAQRSKQAAGSVRPTPVSIARQAQALWPRKRLAFSATVPVMATTSSSPAYLVLGSARCSSTASPAAAVVAALHWYPYQQSRLVPRTFRTVTQRCLDWSEQIGVDCSLAAAPPIPAGT